MRVGSYIARLAATCLLLVATATSLLAAEVKRIVVEGNERVTLGRILTATELRQGGQFTDADISQAIKDIFSTGFFEDVAITSDDGVILITVKELPLINDINIQGSKLIDEEEIREFLDKNNIKEGEILQNTQLNIILKEIEALYAEQGRYGTKVETIAEELPGGNLINLNINIEEKDATKIIRINFIGNDAYSDEDLLELIELKELSKWNSRNRKVQYSRSQLTADIESIRQFYLNNGYAKAAISDNIVSINREKDLISITLKINEGKSYSLSDISFAGNTLLPPQEVLAQLDIASGDRFSQRAVTSSRSTIIDLLGEEGYGLANVNVDYEFDDTLGVIAVNFYVLPGQKTYIRNIHLAGNEKSQHTSIRKYLAQYEGSPYIASVVRDSVARLRRLAHIAGVQVDRQPIPGQPDKLDLVFTLEEAPSGNIGGGLLYSDISGISLTASYSDSNFYGTGNSLSTSLQYSSTVRQINFNLGQPFLNLDGVSGNYFVSYREVDFDETEITDYASSSATTGFSFGYPFSETDRISYGMSFKDINVDLGTSANREITAYTDRYGEDYNDLVWSTVISHNSLNRGFKPTDGHRTSFRINLETPVESGARPIILEETLDHISYFKLSEDIDELALSFGFKLGHFDFAGSDTQDQFLPFYKNYFSGGVNSVRGYAPNSLGPRSTPRTVSTASTTQSQGGNVRILGRAEFIFPFGALSKSVAGLRSSLFWDIGNVFATRCIVPNSANCNTSISYSELRQSVGLSLRWYIQFFPLTFSLSYPLNDRPDDRTTSFQLSLGDAF